MVTGCREFPNSKRAGRNASEPICSLVNELEKPTLWSDVGRPLDGCLNNGNGIHFLPG